MVPSVPGTYLLLLQSEQSTRIEVGRRGLLQVEPGWYIYIGSALGPGGLAARVGHHMRPAIRPRWHIDFLRRRTRLHEVWYLKDPRCHEHRWANQLAAWEGAVLPMSGFGASDCRCLSHLIFFRHLPPLDSLLKVQWPTSIPAQRLGRWQVPTGIKGSG